MVMSGTSIADKAKQGKLTEGDIDFIRDLDNQDLAIRLINSHVLATHKNTHFDIVIQTEDIRNHRHRGDEFVKAKAILDNGYTNTKVEIDCLIFLSDWSKLENLRENRINLVEHFQSLYANKWNGIGLCTFQK